MVQDGDPDPKWSVFKTTVFLLFLGLVLSIVVVLVITASPGH
jgi:hypothetical protein